MPSVDRERRKAQARVVDVGVVGASSIFAIMFGRVPVRSRRMRGRSARHVVQIVLILQFERALCWGRGRVGCF